MTDLFSQGEIAEMVANIAPGELTLEKAVELFETVYMPSRNFSDNTRSAYKRDLAQLMAFIKTCGISKVADVGLSQLRSFLAELDVKGLTGVTRRRKVASIRALFDFLVKDGLVAHNPTLQLIPPKREKKDPRFLTAQEYQALLRACSHEIRDSAIIELILQTGIRLSEVAKLATYDIELPAHINRDADNTGSMSIHGKGKKERTLPLNYKACRALKAWLSIRPRVEGPALFVTKFREPMRPKAIEEVVTKYLKEAGIHGASVHSLRHTFGTHHAMKGTDIRTIQEMLGHESLETTSIYISLAKEAVRRSVQDHAL